MRFKDVGKIRVGVKTTCDKVFIREDWSTLPGHLRPEDSLLLPILTHHVVSRWTAGHSASTILYPYDLAFDKRRPVSLAAFPRTARYFESNRAELESRRYVVEGGRYWWEIWVPQRPSAWQQPKIVFPDISDEPRFCLDLSGAVVNGDCYWMALPQRDPDMIGLLMLAVANSTLATEFYDHSCGNKLYAGRRRYITQYVSEFPIPDPSLPVCRRLVRTADALIHADDAQDRRGMEAELNNLVWRSFGIEERCR